MHVSGAAFLIIAFTLLELLIRLVTTIINVNPLVLEYIHICEMIVIIAGTTWLVIFVLFELAELLIKLFKGQKFLAIFVG